MIPIPAFLSSIATTKNMIIGGLVIAAITGLYIRDLKMRNQIATLSTENVQLHIAIDAANKVIEQQEKDVKVIKDSNKKIIDQNKVLTKAAKDLEETLYRERKKKKSLEQLAIEAASKIEYRVNKASAEVLRCLEIASGSEMKENEREKYSHCNLSVSDD